jgi:hypothetical protein
MRTNTILLKCKTIICKNTTIANSTIEFLTKKRKSTYVIFILFRNWTTFKITLLIRDYQELVKKFCKN